MALDLRQNAAAEPTLDRSRTLKAKDRQSSRRFWWVNHSQTHREEIDGGYVWCPRRKKDGTRNQTYDNLRLVKPGDVIVSYSAARIRQVGVATRPAAPCPKPTEFGAIGANLERDGWMVPVAWRDTPIPVRPKEIIDELRPYLPERHSPLRAEAGDGLQNVYLAAISEAMAAILLDRVRLDVSDLGRMADELGDDETGLQRVDSRIERAVHEDPNLEASER